jgi:nucleotide-binding universal stress UspA family protein
MKNILVPTDFSDNAWDALTYAIRMYDDIPCCYYILNSYEVNPSKISSTMHQFGARKVYDILKDESSEELQKISKHLSENMLNDKHTYKTVSKSGSLIPIVKDIVNKEHIDMIVMGTAGASGLKGVFMGSNTVKVIKHINTCPILSVPEKYVYEEPTKIVFATDFKNHLSEMELRSLIELQLIHNFKIHFLHIRKTSELSEKQQYNMEVLKKNFNNDVCVIDEMDTDSTLSNAITAFAEDQKVNMICLVNHEHSFIEKLTHEPVIKRVSFHSAIPLLILPV